MNYRVGKIFFIIFICCPFGDRASGQLQRGQIDPSKVPVTQPHFQPEYAFDAPADPLRWATQQTGLNAAFGSTDELYMRSEVPDLPTESRLWVDTGWKGERLNAQLLIWSPRPGVEQEQSSSPSGSLCLIQLPVRRQRPQLRRSGDEHRLSHAGQTGEKWLDQLDALQDEWIRERRVQLLIDKGELQQAKQLLLSVPFQKVHQRYSRTMLWNQLCEKLGEPGLPIPAQLGEDQLAAFGAYREFERS